MGRMEMVKKVSGETEWLQKRLDENPHSILFARLADRYLDAGDINRAIEICDKGLEYYPSYATGLFVYAKCLLRKTEYEEAEKQLKKAISINPNNLLALKLYGDLMAEMGWSRTAEECYKKIMDLDPLEQNIRSKLPGSPVTAGRQPIPKQQQKATDERLEIDDKSIENLFNNTLQAQESDESIESLFGGGSDEQADIAVETAPPMRQPEPEYKDESIDSLFASGDQDFSDATTTTTAPLKQNWDDFNDDSIISLFEKEPEPFAESAGEPRQKVASENRQEPQIDEDMFMFGQEEEHPLTADQELSEDNFLQPNVQEEEQEITFPIAGEEEQDLSFPVAGEEEQPEEEFIFPESEQEEQEDFQFPSPATTQGRAVNPEYDKDEDSFIVGEEEEEDYSYSPDKVRPEKDRYSNILDGIFSPGLEDEERKDFETRSKLGGKSGESDFSVGDEEIDQDLFGMGEEPANEDDSLFANDEETEEDQHFSITPEDTIVKKANEARFIQSQPDDEDEDEGFKIPDISEGYLAFEEDDSEENIETEAVHMPDIDIMSDMTAGGFEEEEEELGNFLAGLGGQEDLEELGELGEQEDDIFLGEELEPQTEPERPAGPVFKQPVVEKEPGGGVTPKDKFVTPTLGEIYAAQGQYAKAINVFELLLEKSPDNEFYKSKLDYLKKKLSEENQ